MTTDTFGCSAVHRRQSLTNLPAAVVLMVLTASLPAYAADPWEKMNRGIYRFNDFTDRVLLKPVAKFYKRFTPQVVRQGVSNVFDNLGTPAVAVNQLLQGKPVASASDLGRFVLNTTVGIGGLFDVASAAGLEEHDEDFGQTFGVWGAGSGNYLVLPFLGSSNVRDATGTVLDMFTNPIRLIDSPEVRWATGALYVVDLRAQLLSAESLLVGDEYLFLRDSYSQRRAYLISDGEIEDDPFAEDEFEEDF